MAVTNRDRVDSALTALRRGLLPFVAREYISHHRNRTPLMPEDALNRRISDPKRPFDDVDVASLLRIMWDSWQDIFRKTLGQAERTLVSELRDVRNRWAHETQQNRFSGDDTYRALDSVQRLLTAVGSAAEAEALEKLKNDLLRIRFDEQRRSSQRRAAASIIDSPAAETIKPWRDVVTPHPDVSSGRFQQAEFAADLWQVHQGQGSEEYRDPVEFFRRTFLTASLKQLLAGSISRLSGGAGDPVVQLQTNFGGGKTHSMLALYHLFGGSPAAALAGIDEMIGAAEVDVLPTVRRAVLVGNKLSLGNPVTKPDGTVVRTLWGELAYQIGGAEAFARIAADDERATSPGDRLLELLDDYGPCLVLIDEWVADFRVVEPTVRLPENLPTDDMGEIDTRAAGAAVVELLRTDVVVNEWRAAVAPLVDRRTIWYLPTVTAASRLAEVLYEADENTAVLTAKTASFGSPPDGRRFQARPADASAERRGGHRRLRRPRLRGGGASAANQELGVVSADQRAGVASFGRQAVCGDRRHGPQHDPAWRPGREDVLELGGTQGPQRRSVEDAYRGVPTLRPQSASCAAVLRAVRSAAVVGLRC